MSRLFPEREEMSWIQVIVMIAVMTVVIIWLFNWMIAGAFETTMIYNPQCGKAFESLKAIEEELRK